MLPADIFLMNFDGEVHQDHSRHFGHMRLHSEVGLWPQNSFLNSLEAYNLGVKKIQFTSTNGCVTTLVFLLLITLYFSDGTFDYEITEPFIVCQTTNSHNEWRLSKGTLTMKNANLFSLDILNCCMCAKHD